MSPSLILNRDSDATIKRDRHIPILYTNNTLPLNVTIEQLRKNPYFLENGNAVNIGLTSHLQSHTTYKKEQAQFTESLKWTSH